MISLDLDKAREECLNHLVNLIRIDTSNPPGNEVEAAIYLREVLRREKIDIDPVLLEAAPKRVNLIARLRGDGSLGPLLFLCHTDVVPAQTEGWTHPPFGGVVSDGYVWGRGAVDMKHLVSVMLTVFVFAHRMRLPLRRDLILAATADEESAGESGAGWLFRMHRDLVACDVAVTEGGGFLTYGNLSFALIELGQKGWVTVDLIRRSQARHSSVPTRENCLFEIGAILDRLAHRRFPHNISPLARTFVETLASYLPEPEQSNLLGILDPASFESAIESLAAPQGVKEVLEAVLHSHATPTFVEGGETSWSVPAFARLRLAGRVLPGESCTEWLDALGRIVGSLGEHEVSEFDPGVETSRPSQVYARAASVVSRHYPHARLIPALSLAGGDARHPLLSGADVYTPFILDPEPGTPSPLDLAHACDERISISNLNRCLDCAWDVLCRENGFA